MKFTPTNLFCILCLFGALPTFAQIPLESPYTVIFKIDDPSTIDGEYPYGSPSLWGDTLTQTVTGEVVWAYGPDTAATAAPDTCVCGPIINDVAGKIALIRRGTCLFGAKAYFAWQAGAIGVMILNHYTTVADIGTTLYTMAAPNVEPFQTLVADVDIPAVFLSRASGEAIVPIIDAGQTVHATFYVPRFFNGKGPIAYATPADQVQPIGPFSVDLLNFSPDSISGVETKVEIIDPSGDVTTFNATTNLSANSQATVNFVEDYLPVDIGTYQLIYSNTLNQDSVKLDFQTTEYTYALDNNKEPYDWTQISAIVFDTSASLNFDVGNYYLGGLDGGIATHVTFGLHNPEEFPVGDAFFISVFDIDPEDDDVLPAGATYDNFISLGLAQYNITGNESPDQLLTVELDNPVNFGPNTDLLVMVRYNGVDAATGIPPAYLSTPKYLNYPGLNTMVFTDQLYTDGWSSFDNNIVRLHMDGFVTSTSVPLEKYQVNLYPTPATDHINVEIALKAVSEKVSLIVSDDLGKLVSTTNYSNVKDGNFTINIADLPSGTYFLTVDTAEGFRTKSFVVAR